MKQALRAALYARYSTDKQRKESVEDQRRVCSVVAERQGWQIVATYDDPGISGGTAKRPGYQSLLAAARRREFDVVIAEDLSRLWREQAEMHRAVKEWKDLGVHLCTANGSIDSRAQGYDVVIAVLGVAAEMYRTEGGYRTRRSLEGRAKKCLPTGGRAYGYHSAKETGTGDIAINKQEAKWVEWIFQRSAEGWSDRRIAAELNDKAVPSPGAKWNRKSRREDAKWLQSGVRAILRNEKYVGRVVWGRMKWQRSASDSSKRTKLPGDSPIRHIRPELRIIDDKLWNAVQGRIKAKAAGRTTFHVPASDRRPAHTGHGGTAHKHALSGLLKCSCCKASYSIADSRSYACASHRDGGPSACNNALRARRDVIEGVVVAGLQEHLLRPEWLAKVETWTRDRVRAAQKAQAANANSGADRLKAVEAQIANVADAIATKGLAGSTTMAEKLRALETERDELTLRPAPAAPIRIVPRLGERVKAFLRDLQRALRNNPDQARMYLRRLLAGPVLLEPDGDLLYANFAMDDTRVALNVSATPGVRDLGGSGGRI